MLIFDAHLDLAFNAVDWNRDLRMDLAEIRGQEGTLKVPGPGRGNSTVSFPELRRGGIGMGVATLFARVEHPINHPFGCTTAEACYSVAMSHLHYYRAMERSGWMRGIRTRGELRQFLTDYHNDPARTPFGYIISMECADAVLAPDNIRERVELGLRAIGITHYGANRYGGGTRSEVGLAMDALPLLRLIEELDIALDCVTHAGARGCGFDAYGLVPGSRADLVLIDAQTVAQAIVTRPPRRLVVAGGRVVARNGELLPDVVSA